jgi:hypothetical protein
MAEIRNKEGFLDQLTGSDKNEDGSPVQEVVEDGDVVAEIHNKEGFLDQLTGSDKNEDGTPVKEVTSTGD